MDKPSILVFGLGFLQRSLIAQCKALGLFTVGIDVTPEAACRDEVDAFEVAAGDDFEQTLAVAQKYHVSGVVTAATDKPLVMMAQVAQTLKLPFYSEETARWSTDKLLMKQRFMEHGIPCAKGMELTSVEELDRLSCSYPVIVKPRDNSGSRGVVFCKNKEDAARSVSEAFAYTHKGTILVEEFIDGQEYSIESLHYHGKTHVIQFTQKITTAFPYNVELGHIQPAALTDEQKEKIRAIIERIAGALDFDNCASHTELKVQGERVTVIETSPRLGGDFITSLLTPLSTGVNLEKLLVRMSIGDDIPERDFEPTMEKSAGVVFFELQEGKIGSIGDLERIKNIPGCRCFAFDKKAGDIIGRITNSIDRYGYAVFQTENRKQTELLMEKIKKELAEQIQIEAV